MGSFRVAFGVMLGDQLGEFIAWNLVKQLTEWNTNAN